MSEKHSPGPWRWKDPLDNKGEYPCEVARLLDRDGRQVCDFGDATQYYPSEGTPPNEADARLIAAAPEMLAKLRDVQWAEARGRHSCHWCKNDQEEGHQSDCEIALFLARIDGGP